MDDTIDIEQHQHARFHLADGRVVIYYTPDSNQLIVKASAGLQLQVQKDADETLSITARLESA